MAIIGTIGGGGGEEVIGLFSALTPNTSAYSYTVPAGQYLKLDFCGAQSETGGIIEIRWNLTGTSSTHLAYGNGVAGPLNGGPWILHSGTVLYSNTFASQARLAGRLFNNP